ncbi:allophanate hydrolase subunit 1 [Salinibacter ruber]|nr:allophanate hydrolase subunit 1 [Salinibacter ruber]
MKPQRPPQSTTNTEAQTLRQMVQEREEEIQKLRAATKKAIALLVSYQNRIDGPGGSNLAECISQLQSLHPEWDVDGGGDES